MFVTYPRVRNLSGCWLPIRTYPDVGTGCGPWCCIWIGTAHLDRLLTYPRVRNLSGCWLPIRVVVSYAGSVSRSAAEGHRNVVLGASTGDDILAWD